MPRKEKQKIEPVFVSSREAMISHVNDVVTAKLRIVEIKAQLEQEIAALQKQRQGEIDTLCRVIATKEAGVQLFCTQHRKTEFDKKKSIDLTLAVVGFEDTPASLEKVGKATWEEIAERMAGLILHEVDANGVQVLGPDKKPIVSFDGDDYVNYGTPTLDKVAVKRDAEMIPAEVFKAVGIRIEKDEIFYIRPKSDVAEATVKAAA